MSKFPMGWEATDGETTALLLTADGKLLLWSNLCEWIEVQKGEHETALEAANVLVESYKLQPMSDLRLKSLTNLTDMILWPVKAAPVIELNWCDGNPACECPDCYQKLIAQKDYEKLKY